MYTGVCNLPRLTSDHKKSTVHQVNRCFFLYRDLCYTGDPTLLEKSVELAVDPRARILVADEDAKRPISDVVRRNNKTIRKN